MLCKQIMMMKDVLTTVGSLGGWVAGGGGGGGDICIRRSLAAGTSLVQDTSEARKPWE
jgi:hypothetical protein